ncbi:MAG: alpha/beta hydrolase [Eubacteriales bacterium]|nr:alpha/beta hydrolase [Eubacteriales bacterium]
MFAEVCGAKIRYEIFGEGKKKLVLLHGWGGTVDSFLPLIRDLKAEFSMLVPEFAGHGLSSEPPVPWSVTEYMEATAELMRKAGFAGADVAAHSFGCRVAILLAAEHPELVGRMLFTGAAGLIPKRTDPEEKHTGTYQKLKKLASLPILPKGVQENLRERLVQKYGSPDYKVLSPSMRATFNRVIHQDLEGYLEKIQSPVFLFWGEKDTATPVWMAKVMEEKIPDSALTIVPECGHFAYLEAYEQFRSIALALFA